MAFELAHDRRVALALALCGGLALRFGMGLHPVWWLAWLAPAPLLLAALRSPPRAALGLTLLGSLLAASTWHAFFARMMPWPAAILVTVLLALPWTVAIAASRRAMTRSASAWTVLAYPVLMAAIDTAMAHAAADGNWSSIAHSQAGFAPAVQVLSLAGVAGLVFLMSLVPAVLALAGQRGWRAARVPALCTAVLVAASFTFGWLRVAAPPMPGGDLVGIAVIDDSIGPRTPAAERERILSQYERHAAALAARGARIVVLPEKIAVLDAAEADVLQQRFARLAARTGAWIEAGVGVVDARGKRNLAWLFAPDGRLDVSYQKHHMAPPEREFLPGADFGVRTIGATRYGLAICKDMHFAGMGLAYGTRQAAAMLVPAWDFDVDAEYEARLSALRGVENGYAMVRGAREGLLSVTDGMGRVVAETRSAPLPGATLLARVPAPGPAPTLYGRTGDLFGWLCTGAALLLLAALFVPMPGWLQVRRRAA